MATTQWTGGNGNWTDPTWTDGIPDSTINAIIDGTTANPVTVTFDSPSGAALSLDTDNATLAVTSGTLSLGAASTLDAITQSGGLLDFAAGGTITGPLSETGGTIENDSGTLALDGDATLGGTIAGSGAVESINTGSGTTTISGLTIANSATFVSSGQNGLPGAVTQTGLLTLGNAIGGGATVINLHGIGIWELANASADIVEAAGSHSSFINNGMFEDDAAGTVSVSADFVNNSSVFLDQPDATLLFSGGSFANHNYVAVSRGNIVIGPDVTNENFRGGTLYGDHWVVLGGSIAMAGGPITALGGHADVELDSPSEIEGINGTSSTPIQQSLRTIADGTTLETFGEYTFTNALTVGGEVLVPDSTIRDSAGLQVGATGNLECTAGSGLVAAHVVNSGTIVAKSFDQSPVTLKFTGSLINDGTLEADSHCVIDISGSHNVIGGRLNGFGEILFSGGTSTITAHAGGNLHAVGLGAGATLVVERSVPVRAFTDIANGGISTVDLTGHTVDVTNSTFEGGALVDGGGTVAGVGTMALGGLALDGGTTLVNAKLANQTGMLALGDASGGTASITNLAGATWKMSGSASISAASPSADTVTNAGTFEKTGSGMAVIGAAFTNTGTIDVTAGTLEITAPFTDMGTIIGSEIQSGGTTFITAPAALFNQYAAALDSPAGGAGASFAHPPATAAPTLAAPHAV